MCSQTLLRKLAAVMSVLLLLCIGPPVMAEEYPDVNRICSLTMTLTSDSKPVGGGEASIYKVADLELDAKGYSYKIADPFTAADTEIKSDTALDEDLSAKFARYLTGQPLASASVQSNGEFSFTGLKPGLYMIVQTKAADGYERFLPFLVSLPFSEDGKYVYDANGSPKIAKKVAVKKLPEKSKPAESTPASTLQPASPTQQAVNAVHDYLNTSAGRNQLIALIVGTVSLVALGMLKYTHRKANVS